MRTSLRSHRKFDRNRPLVSRKSMTVFSKLVAPGDPLPANLPEAVARRLWVTGRADYGTNVFTMAEVKRGLYLISGPDEFEPVEVKGKKKAVAAMEEFEADYKAEQEVLNAPPVILIGSDSFPDQWNFDGTIVTLGDVVSAAQLASGFAPEEWNELEDADRDDLITQALERRKDEL